MSDSHLQRELSNNALRDTLVLACDEIERLANGGDPAFTVGKLQQWRDIIVVTFTSDDEDDPPFTEHAREAAWRAWIAALAGCGRTRKVQKPDIALFREWWWDSCERRKRGVLSYDAERMTPEQVDRLNARYQRDLNDAFEDDD